jgi:hypothetical protein
MAAAGTNDKNLTGRLYELVDEVRLVHEHLPRALMTGIFFLPIAAATDKPKGKSSFAHTVVKLRERTGRLDPSLAHHAHRCDCAFVGLYRTGTEGGYPAGIVRFLNVSECPNFRDGQAVRRSKSRGRGYGRLGRGMALGKRWLQPRLGTVRAVVSECDDRSGRDRYSEPRWTSVPRHDHRRGSRRVNSVARTARPIHWSMLILDLARRSRRVASGLHREDIPRLDPHS